MKSLALAASTLAFAACATSGQGLPARDETGAAVPQLDLHATSADNAERTFPERLTDARLPAADHLSHRIAAEYAGAIAAQVRLCVTPAGKVSSVDLIAPSGMDAYDRAVVDAIAGWQYEAFAAPDVAQVCERLTVAYRTP